MPPSASAPNVALGHVLRRRFVSVTNTMVAVRLRSWSPILGRRGSRATGGDGAGSLDEEEVRHCLIQKRLSKQDLGNLPQEESIFAFWLTWGRKRRRIQREPQRFSGA